MGEYLYIIENTASSTSKIFRQPYISKPLHEFIGCNFNAVPEGCLVVQPSPSHQHGPLFCCSVFIPTPSLRPSAVLIDTIFEQISILIFKLIIYCLCFFSFRTSTDEKRTQIVVFTFWFSHVSSVIAWQIFLCQKESRRIPRLGLP